MTRRRALLTLSAPALLAVAGLGGCAELRRPNVAWPVPPGLLPPGQEPGRAAVNVMAQDMLGASNGLRNEPARIARAAGLMEWMAVELNAPRWQPVPAEARGGIALARDEMRGALGADPLADSPRMAAALAGAYRALARGDRSAAATALPRALFPRGGEAALARLSDPGPLPQGEISTAFLAERVRALDEVNGWGADFDMPVPPDRGGRGPIPFGL